MNLNLGDIRRFFKAPAHEDDATTVTAINRDSRSIKPCEVYWAIRGKRLDGHDFIDEALKNGALAVIADRKEFAGDRVILVDDTVKAMGQLAQMYRRRFDKPVIAITGSSGKTTTKELLTHVLSQQGNVVSTKGNLNNHIGVPITMFDFNDKADFFVVELGMSCLGEIDYLTKMVEPDMGLITSVGRAHLEGVGGTIDNVAKAKGELFKGLFEKAVAFVFSDDPLIDGLETSAKRVTFGFESGRDVRALNLKVLNGTTEFKLQVDGNEFDAKIQMVGQHHVQNAAAVVGICRELGLSMDLILKGLESFSITMNRGQTLIKYGMTIVDNSYNANPESMKLALKSLVEAYPKKTKVAVLGDMLELGAAAPDCHNEVGAHCKNLGIDQLFAYGVFSKDYLRGFDQGLENSFVEFEPMAKALKDFAKGHKGNLAMLLMGSRGNRMETLLDYL